MAWSYDPANDTEQTTDEIAAANNALLRNQSNTPVPAPAPQTQTQPLPRTSTNPQDINTDPQLLAQLNGQSTSTQTTSQPAAQSSELDQLNGISRDPALLAQLNVQSVPTSQPAANDGVNRDPQMLAQLNGQPKRTFGDMIQDMYKGSAAEFYRAAGKIGELTGSQYLQELGENTAAYLDKNFVNRDSTMTKDYQDTATEVFDRYADVATSAIKNITLGYGPDAVKTPEDAGIGHRVATFLAGLSGAMLPMAAGGEMAAGFVPEAWATASSALVRLGSGALQSAIGGGIYGVSKSAEPGESVIMNGIKEAGMWAGWHLPGALVGELAGKIMPVYKTAMEKIFEQNKLAEDYPEFFNQLKSGAFNSGWNGNYHSTGYATNVVQGLTDKWLGLQLEPAEKAAVSLVGYGKAAATVGTGMAIGAAQPAKDMNERMSNIAVMSLVALAMHGMTSIGGGERGWAKEGEPEGKPEEGTPTAGGTETLPPQKEIQYQDVEGQPQQEGGFTGQTYDVTPPAPQGQLTDEGQRPVEGQPQVPNAREGQPQITGQPVARSEQPAIKGASDYFNNPAVQTDAMRLANKKADTIDTFGGFAQGADRLLLDHGFSQASLDILNSQEKANIAQRIQEQTAPETTPNKPEAAGTDIEPQEGQNMPPATEEGKAASTEGQKPDIQAQLEALKGTAQSAYPEKVRYINKLIESYGGGTPMSYSAAMDKLFKETSDKPGALQRVALGEVSSKNVEEVRRTAKEEGRDVDVTGYTHTIDNSFINHVIGGHTDIAKEKSRGQEVVTKEDILRIPEIIANPNDVKYLTETKKSKDGVLYTKRINGEIYYYEEIRQGRKELAAATLFKKRATLGEQMPHTETPLTQPNLLRGSSYDSTIPHPAEPVKENQKPTIEEQLNNLKGKRKNPLSNESGAVDVEKIKEAGKEAAGHIKDSWDEIKNVLAPASAGFEAKKEAGMVRESAAYMARKMDIATTALKKARDAMSNMPMEDRLSFIRAVEQGTKGELSPELQDVADKIKRLLDQRVEQVRALGTGKLKTLIENYFPHIWENPKKAVAAAAEFYSKRPLEGSKSFLKQRTIMTVDDGLARGLKLKLDNPIDMALFKMGEMDKYIMAHSVLNEMKAKGYADFVRIGKAAPAGWKKIDDKIVSVMYKTEKGENVLSGHYYAPEDAARIINNYLSPGLRDMSKVFKAYLGVGNVLNQFQLGFSGWHAMTTSVNSIISGAAAGIENLAHGEVKEGLKNILTSPVAPITDFKKGLELEKEWSNPTGQGLVGKMADALQAGGGRAQQDKFFATRMWQKMTDAFKQGSYGEAALRAPFALAEKAAQPIMEKLVPRLKMGAFWRLAEAEMNRNPDMSVNEMRQKMGDIWDSIDNRFGQVVYDNIFWNKVTKDIMMASVRSVGWTGGTIREIGGAGIDAVKAVKGIATGKASADLMTHKMAYTISLVGMTGLAGALTQYLMTGKKPESLTDLYYPQTGNLDERGNPERISFPTYMKDIVSYGKHTGQTITNKVHPMLSLVSDILNNKDFYGTKVYNEGDNPGQKALDIGKHIGAAFEPFASRGIRKNLQNNEGKVNSETLLPFVGITPAPAELTKTKAQNLLDEEMHGRAPIGGRTTEQARQHDLKIQIERLMKKDAPAGIALLQKNQSKFSPKEMQQLVSYQNKPITPFKEAFKRAPIEDALKVFDVATPQEKKELLPILAKNTEGLSKLSADRRVAVLEQMKRLQTGIYYQAVLQF
ncbi:MAG: hypothetical protein HQK98_06555 [Nitrospirae bacterium]|nr:hypothetical protein [Nitrospirota bacterium]